VKRERLEFLADNPHFTKRFAFYVGRRCAQASIRDVAKELKRAPRRGALSSTISLAAGCGGPSSSSSMARRGSTRPSPPSGTECRSNAARFISSLTSIEVRRLIAMRNWRPENERAEVDAVIRKARAAGIDCAPWEAGNIEAIVATAIDGATAQGVLLISPAGRKKRISSVLTKGGILDA
jgi:hypothetical protein